MTNFGWEYVWHCHILSHEEMDMMRPITVSAPRTLPDASVLSFTRPTSAVLLAWTDGTPISITDPTTWGSAKNEIGYKIERAPLVNGAVGSYAQIATTLANVASYTDNTAGTGQYAYRVTAWNAAGNTVSAPLLTASTVPQVTSRNPVSGATGVASNVRPTATFNEAVTGVSNTTFTLQQGTTAVPATVAYDAATRTATLTPTSTLTTDKPYTLSLTTVIKSVSGGSLAATTWTFTTGPAPTVTSTNPAAGATGVGLGTATNRTPLRATFSEAVTGLPSTAASTPNFTLKLGTATIASKVSYNTTTRIATLTPDAPLLSDRTYTLTLSSAVKDVAGNPLTAKTWTFITGPAPTVTSTNPAAGATGVGLGTATNRTPLRATFSEAVTGLPSTAASTPNFTLKLGTATIASKVSYNTTTRIATLTPDAPLLSDRTYTLTLSSAVKDVAGNPLTAKTWTFITGPVPVVTARTPAVNATNVSRTANISATFSEAVTGLPGTAAASGNFTITRSSTGAAFTSVVSYSSTTRVATLNPTGTLLANTKYTVTLSSGIKDTAGNPLALVTWSFTTGN